jgi:(S)-ureidoglycine aminohydrolase
MLQGDAIMHIDGVDYETSAGDVIFLDSMVPHGITNAGETPCEYFAFQWK